MAFYFEKIICQDPKNTNNINREYLVIKAVLNNNETMLENFKNKAWDLAKQVNPHKANDSTNQRDKENLIRDAMGEYCLNQLGITISIWYSGKIL